MPIPKGTVWGPNQESTGYRFLMAGKRFPQIVPLDCGYSVGQPEYEETDRVQQKYWCYDPNLGRNRPVTVTIRGAEIREITYQLMLKQGNILKTPLHDVAGRDCERDYFMLFNCPENSDYAHFYHLPHGRTDQIKRDSIFIEGKDGSGTPFDASTQLHTPREDVYFAIIGVERQTAGDPVQTIAFDPAQCAGCDPNENLTGFYGGEDTFFSTADGFVTGSAVSIGLPSGAIAQSTFVEGDHILVGYAASVAGTGGIRRSIDGGASWSDASPTSSPEIFKITYGGGLYYAVGGTGGIFTSPDGATWTAITNTLYPAATDDLKDAAWDEGSQTLYIAGGGAANGIALALLGSALADIGTQVKGSLGSLPLLSSVKVLNGRHVAFGGASGFFSESPEASDGTLFKNASVGTGTITTILGNHVRTLVGGGTAIRVRDGITQFDWRQLRLVNNTTITGNITDGAEGKFIFGMNDFVFSTDAGEIIRVAPTYPGAQ